jgi:transposase-like protein
MRASIISAILHDTTGESEMTMTNQEYLDHGGTKCPHCGSLNLTGDHVQVDAGTAWQDIICDDCGKEWQDTYTLTGFADTNK